MEFATATSEDSGGGGGDLEYLLRLLHWTGTLRHPRADRRASRAFYARNAVVAVSVLLFVCSQAAVILLEGTADLDRFTRALCFFNTAGTWLLRLAHVAVTERRFHAMALQMDSDFGEFVTRRDATLLRVRGRSQRRFVGAYLGDGLPFHMALPYSVDQPLAFAATWFYCFCMTMHVAVVTMVFDSYNISLMAHLRQQLSVLSSNVLALAEEARHESLSLVESSPTSNSSVRVDNTRIRYRLRSIIRHHQAIIRNVESLEKCLGGMLLGQSLSIGASICFQLFQLATSAESLAEAGKFGCYLSVMLAQLFVYCWFGDELITESENVSTVVYSTVTSLQGYPVTLKRSLLLMMTRAQRPLHITAAGFFDLSRESFVKVLNVSYSFFAILRNFKEE
ncbi:putative odorant receptor 92a [Schistocerca nitens]|uniref:putative odorant receptor 92a n=1 Tax=Schistocerca nitens TaxID=7011 RepID=UPI00211779A6|nr:putative odorant receptor 92a [Schistocerca nitens]